MTSDGGAHFAPPSRRRAERALFLAGVAALAVSVVCIVVGADLQTGFVVLGASCVLGGIAERARTDPSAWRFDPGKIERQVFLIALGTVAVVGSVAGLVQIAGNV
jgi:hypothetical protein